VHNYQSQFLVYSSCQMWWQGFGISLPWYWSDGACYNKGHGCMTSGLSCGGSAIPFLERQFPPSLVVKMLSISPVLSGFQGGC
jgi:hypothetical protein